MLYRERGYNGLFITLVSNDVFLFVGLTSLETFTELRFMLCYVFKRVLTTNFNVQNLQFLCVIIRDVHQFIGHCLIPLDPCFHSEVMLCMANLGKMSTKVPKSFFFILLQPT